MLPVSPHAYRAQRLSAAAAQDRSAAAECFGKSAIVSEGVRELRPVVVLLWTLTLLSAYFGGIVPAWAVVLSAALGYPALLEALKTPARRLYREGEALEKRAENYERQATELLSGSTSGDTEAPQRN